jgi:membrane-bound lytic murein transglycosylase B
VIELANVVRACEPKLQRVCKVFRVSAYLMFVFAVPCQADYRQHPEAQKFVDEMVRKHNFTRSEMNGWLANAEKKQAILDAISRPAEQSKPWKDYRSLF